MKPEDLKKKLDDLDEASLETSWSKEELWHAVESRLSDHKKRRRLSKAAPAAWPWAAVVLLAIGFYWWSAKDPAIKLETESVVAFDETSDDFRKNDELSEGKQLIHETCSKQLEICDSPQFISLYQELLEIEEEKSLLEELVGQYGSDEVAIRALIQLENAESSITGKLISLIMT